MAKEKKFYVVFDGKQPGIYETWSECQKQVKGVKGSKFKSFTSYEEAERAFNKHTNHESLSKEEIDSSISVDASCLGVPGVMEYQVVHTISKEKIFESPTYPLGTNNIAEFLSLVKAMQIVKESGNMNTVIFADSQTALSWIKKKKYNTNLIKNDVTAPLYEKLEEAVSWLSDINVDDYRIIKWESHIFGEIPADYNRKTKR